MNFQITFLSPSEGSGNRMYNVYRKKKRNWTSSPVVGPPIRRRCLQQRLRHHQPSGEKRRKRSRSPKQQRSQQGEKAFLSSAGADIISCRSSVAYEKRPARDGRHAQRWKVQPLRRRRSSSHTGSYINASPRRSARHRA